MSTDKAQGKMHCFLLVTIPSLEKEASDSSVEETHAELVKRGTSEGAVNREQEEAGRTKGSVCLAKGRLLVLYEVVDWSYPSKAIFPECVMEIEMPGTHVNTTIQ